MKCEGSSDLISLKKDPIQETLISSKTQHHIISTVQIHWLLKQGEIEKLI